MSQADGESVQEGFVLLQPGTSSPLPEIEKKYQYEVRLKEIENQETPEVENEPSWPEGEKTFQYVAAMAASLAAFGVGNSLAWIFPGLTHLTRHKEIHNNGSFENCMAPSEPLNTEQTVWVLLLLELGAIFGAIFSGWCINFIGRKWMIIVANIIGILSWLFIIFGFDIGLIYAGRFLSGIAVGSLSIAVPILLREITENSNKQSIGSCFEAMLCLGIMFYYILDLYIPYLWLNVIFTVIPFISLLIMIFLSDTPKYWLIRKNTENAEAALRFYRGDDYKIDPEINYLQNAVKNKKLISPIRKLISREHFATLCVCFATMLIRQLSSIYLMVLFRENQEIHESTGEATCHICLLVIGSIQTAGTFLSLLIVEKTSKKIQLLFYVVTIIANVASSQFYNNQESQPAQNATEIAIAPAAIKEIVAPYISMEALDLLSVNLLLVSSTLGWGPIPWLVMGDLFHPSLEGTATLPCCLLILAIVIFISIVFTNFILAVGLIQAFWFLGMFATFAIGFIYFLVSDSTESAFSAFTSWIKCK